MLKRKPKKEKNNKKKKFGKKHELLFTLVYFGVYGYRWILLFLSLSLPYFI